MKYDYGPILNAYPDSLGGTLSDIVKLLQKTEFNNVFSGFYILPSLFNSDLDRGFSIIDYNLNESYATLDNLADLRNMGISLKLDFVINHASVLSPQFQDLLHKGMESEYASFFINWNSFWKNYGEMVEGGYVQPDQEFIQEMFFRKPGLPLLMVRLPDGTDVPFWNTFYQEISYPRPDAQDIMKETGLQYTAANCLAKLVCLALDKGIKPSEMRFPDFEAEMADVVEWLESRKKYLGQMDLDIRSPLVWQYYQDTLKTLASYGASIVRLDAFAYAPKEPGKRNFLNEPGTWELLEKIKNVAEPHGLTLLPEIHASYEEKIHEKLSNNGYTVYDFFLPGLIIDAFERGCGEIVVHWAKELIDKKISTVNMLGCHDGIPLLDLKGLVAESQIQKMIDTIVRRGGFVKNLHGQENMYYQVNATYYSALGEDDRKFLMARAVQLFMPGRPQIWYLDLFAGKNDYDAVKKAGPGGHKEINRTNLTLLEIENALKRRLVIGQLSMLRFRNTFPAFHPQSEIVVNKLGQSGVCFTWSYNGHLAVLEADFSNGNFLMQGMDADMRVIFEYKPFN